MTIEFDYFVVNQHSGFTLACTLPNTCEGPVPVRGFYTRDGSNNNKVTTVNKKIL